MLGIGLDAERASTSISATPQHFMNIASQIALLLCADRLSDQLVPKTATSWG